MSSARSYRYRVVDVFTDQAMEGNALAVFPDASGIDDITMQKIAKELNLSETSFVIPATRTNCSVGVRIFTPSKEMDFAGHPTIGTSFVLLDEGIIPADSEHFVLEEKVGPVPVRVDTGIRPLIWLQTPPISRGITFDRTACSLALGLNTSDLLPVTPQLLSAGNPTVFIALKDRDAVDRAWLDSRGSAALRKDYPEPMCVFVFTPTPDGAYSRMFAPEYGIAEDPATGSSTGPLAAYMMQHGLVACTAGTRLTSEQGTKMGRRSILHVHIHGDRGQEGIEVGGRVVSVAEAIMRF
ncbi:PhzF family phenazine biosynthesis protein [Desulfuromonas acetoxidans]|nr:PhzF family phenazine biosynthesis protein [Desulfuromonas acetoxidans]MBF0646790.1 PhzF family phenazine biosynthesis protein [Desulfuromonas acetoxidans]NVD24632.1 PhzF family phenazine biosynthesis protein [Desulfuromonas acetoxidans]NVE17995.1 PhzF family phenazine biosynthesis protein [Desulfuromonas acetoxidans]